MVRPRAQSRGSILQTKCHAVLTSGNPGDSFPNSAVIVGESNLLRSVSSDRLAIVTSAPELRCVASPPHVVEMQRNWLAPTGDANFVHTIEWPRNKARWRHLPRSDSISPAAGRHRARALPRTTATISITRTTRTSVTQGYDSCHAFSKARRRPILSARPCSQSSTSVCCDRTFIGGRCRQSRSH